MRHSTAVRASALALPFVGIIAIGLALCSSPASGRPNGRAKVQLPKAQPKDVIAPAPLIMSTLPNPTGFRVVPAAGLRGDKLTLHNRIAAGLSRTTFVPDERINASKWLENHPTLVFRGWDASIVGVELVQGGYLVRLQVSPAVASTEGGCTVILPSTVESWFIGKTSSEYLGSHPSQVPGGSLGL